METIGWLVAVVSTITAVVFAMQRQRLAEAREADRDVVTLAEADADAAEAALEGAVARHRRDIDRLTWVVGVDGQRPVLSARGHLTTLRRNRGDRLTTAERHLLDNAIGDLDLAVRLYDAVRAWAETQQDAPQLQPVPLREPLDAALAELDHDGNATVDVEPLPTATTDPELLAEALLEVLDNCVRYRPVDAPVHIVVTGEEHNDHVELQVRDDGLGIQTEDPTRLFEPFARGDGAAAMPGVGLGLARARRIVEALGGTIAIRANPDGPGSTVVCTLPTGPA